jgi:proteasome activator subunit 4
MLTNRHADSIYAWGRLEDPKDLRINWHVPSVPEVEFAVDLFSAQANAALEALTSLTSDDSGIKRDGIGKEWSDEVSKNLVLLRLATSGASALFDPQYIPGGTLAEYNFRDDDIETENDDLDGNEDEHAGDDITTTHRYPAGYAFGNTHDPLYITLHKLRDRIGEILHQVHSFLTTKQEDDVACFNALYTVSCAIPTFWIRC